LELRRAGKTALIYLEIAALCVLFHRVYALFGHGVSSAAMTLMFLYPLIGGALPLAAFWLVKQRRTEAVRGRRMLFNAYNSGVAALTVASMLIGILEVAGTSSPHIIWLTAVGAALCAFGAVGYLTGYIRHAKAPVHTGTVHR
jgi:hypothetical protein